MPVGVLVTEPLPVPVLLTLRLTGCKSKMAVTEVVVVSVTTQAPVPLHPAPLHPVKVEPTVGAAVRFTTVPLAKLPEQLGPQVIPAGALVAVPLPAPIFTTARPNV